jgi:hypothetical protein
MHHDPQLMIRQRLWACQAQNMLVNNRFVISTQNVTMVSNKTTQVQ